MVVCVSASNRIQRAVNSPTMTPDALILAADSALRTLLAEPHASRATPAAATS